MRTLYVAAGGGGDAVGALLARRALGDTDERPPLVTTCAWERLRIDPVPGPRARADFGGLGLVGGELCEVLPSSDTAPSGRSVLPRLAATSGARVFLHDFEGGAIGLADQLRRLSESLDVDRLVLVDVGGDVMARGSELGLKSPLADSLTLAAAIASGIHTTAVVLGPGSDAELAEEEVLQLLATAHGERAGRVGPDDVEALKSTLMWHPTEATALVAAAALGLRGFVAMRRGREPVPLTDRTAEIWTVPSPMTKSFDLAELVSSTASIAEAEEAIRSASVNEIDFERRVAAERRSPRTGWELTDVISDMEVAGATHVTSRRLLEVLSAALRDVVLGSPRRADLQIWSKDDLAQLAHRLSSDR